MNHPEAAAWQYSDCACPLQPPEQLQQRMQAMAAAIKQEEAAQADALQRQRAMEKRLHEISKACTPNPAACQHRPSYAPHMASHPVRLPHALHAQ